MGFHKDGGDTHCDGGPRQGGDEFSLTSGAIALAARLRHRMRGVEHHRTTDLRHDRQRAHVVDQGVVAERDPAFAGHDVDAAGLDRFGNDVGHVPRRKEGSFLDVQRLARPRRGDDQVSLAAEKGGYLQHVRDLGHG